MPPFTHPRLAEIAGYLDFVRTRLTAVVEETPDSVIVALPADDDWNGAQIVQHLGKVEGATAKMLEGLFGAALAAGFDLESETSSVLGALDRFQGDSAVLRRLVAPERLWPATDARLAESWALLTSVRGRIYRAYATVDGRALASVSAPHPLFGPLNAYEWLLFIGKHEERHLGQLQRHIASVTS